MVRAATADPAVVDGVRATLRAHADPAKAPAMQAYMKSQLPFLGIPKPVRTAVLRTLWAAHRPTDRPVWEATIRELYDAAAYREERYAALALLDHRGARSWHDPDLLALIEHLVVTGAWWDLVDDLAHHARTVLLAEPTATRPTILRWTVSEDRWLRRISVICQVGAKVDTDLALLDATITANAADPDFFLRKAIGWALRDYAWTDPAWVAAYVAAHEDQLSPLSRREALKNISRTAALTT